MKMKFSGRFQQGDHFRSKIEFSYAIYVKSIEMYHYNARDYLIFLFHYDDPHLRKFLYDIDSISQTTIISPNVVHQV